MCLEIDEEHIISARRIGKGMPGKPEIPRPILVQVHPTLREQILGNLKNLKGKVNDRKRSYRITKQLPDEWIEVK